MCEFASRSKEGQRVVYIWEMRGLEPDILSTGTDGRQPRKNRGEIQYESLMISAQRPRRNCQTETSVHQRDIRQLACVCGCSCGVRCIMSQTRRRKQ